MAAGKQRNAILTYSGVVVTFKYHKQSPFDKISHKVSMGKSKLDVVEIQTLAAPLYQATMHRKQTRK